MTLDIEGVLAGHHIQHGASLLTKDAEWYAYCSCSKWSLTTPNGNALYDAHRTHVAAVLREQIAAWLKSPDTQNLLAEILAPVMRAWGVKSGHGEWTDAETCGHAGAEGAAKVRAALAAQVAPSRVPGEGS